MASCGLLKNNLFFLLGHYGCLAFVLIRECGEVSGEELGVTSEKLEEA